MVRKLKILDGPSISLGLKSFKKNYFWAACWNIESLWDRNLVKHNSRPVTDWVFSLVDRDIIFQIIGFILFFFPLFLEIAFFIKSRTYFIYSVPYRVLLSTLPPLRLLSENIVVVWFSSSWYRTQNHYVPVSP